MDSSGLKILVLHNYHPALLDELYRSDSVLPDLDFEQQRRRVQSAALSVADSYAYYLRTLGCDAEEIILNADPLQERWAKEQGFAFSGDLGERRAQVVAAQVRQSRPDVLLVFEWCPLGDAFLAEVKPLVRLLVGQVASPLPPNRTYLAYDLMLSSFPPLVDHFREVGIDAEPLKLGFDPRVLEALPGTGERVSSAAYDVTFVGGFAPSHPDRIPWLEMLLERIDVAIFGYGVDNTRQDSAIRSHHHGTVWGLRMFEVLRQSRVTLNRHARIELDGRVTSAFANNMRLYEATGMGTCLITEERDNLSGMFEPGREVITYRNEADCVEKIRYYLAKEAERETIARAGRQRTLRDHTYEIRMSELLEIIRRRL